jgi:hypothetical protein
MNRTFKTTSACLLLALFAAACGGTDPTTFDTDQPADSAGDQGSANGSGEAIDTSVPATVTPMEVARRRQMLRDYDTGLHADLVVKATTVTPTGRTVDWIDPASQVPDGQLASPPPSGDSPELVDPVVSELELPGAERGPEGTVPIFRLDVDRIPDQDLPDSIESFLSMRSKVGLPDPVAPDVGFSDSTHYHYHAGASQTVLNWGTDGVLWVTNPYVYGYDEFSLGQLALYRGTGSARQTIEAGWQLYPRFYGDSYPHFFTFFTTVNYARTDHYVGGYNETVLGFVRSGTSSLVPGAALVSGSELGLEVLNWQSNWWIKARGEWIGYYPGWMFSTAGLRSSAQGFMWFGEVTDYIYDGVQTYSYMGTGASAGSGAAYMRNLRYQVESNKLPMLQQAMIQEKPQCYSVAGSTWTAGTWGSNFRYGGKGAYTAGCK